MNQSIVTDCRTFRPCRLLSTVYVCTYVYAHQDKFTSCHNRHCNEPLTPSLLSTNSLTSQLSTLLRHLPMKWMFSTLLFRSLTVCATAFISSTADFMCSQSGWLLSVYLRSSWIGGRDHSMCMYCINVTTRGSDTFSKQSTQLAHSSTCILLTHTVNRCIHVQ